MSEAPELDRLQRSIEDLAKRVRVVEDVESPYARQLVGEFRKLQDKVDDIDSHGATTTRIELREMRKDIENIERAFKDRDKTLAEDAKWARRMMLTALFSGALALVLFIVEFLVNKATGP